MVKRVKIFYKTLLFLSLTITLPLTAQEESTKKFRTGADFYSSFIWRGTRLGTGPAVQPVVEYASTNFKAGAWGSFDFKDYQEVDLYINFSLPAGFSIGITDYYSPDLRYFDYSRAYGSHAFELNLGFSMNNLKLEADYIFNEAGGIGSSGQDLYFQAGYSFKSFGLFAGAGNGWLTYDTQTNQSRFNLCNLGLEVSRTIKITETFEIPVLGRLVFNPDKEQLFVVVGFTL
jgi:hypothetical protein